MNTDATPATSLDAKRLAHFNRLLDGGYDLLYPDHGSLRVGIVRKRQHLGGGLYNPYYAVRVRRIDGSLIYEKPCTPIRYDDGSVSIWWHANKEMGIFAIDNVKLPQ